MVGEIVIGSMIKVYDACFQCNVVEPVVRIENGSYGELIYTHRKNPLGYDERLVHRKDIKEICKPVEHHT